MKASFENLKPLVHCPLCEKKYDSTETVFLEETDDRTTFHLTCPECSVSTFVFVTAGQMGVASFGILTDVDRSEAKTVYGREAVSSDDVIEAHALLLSRKRPISLLKYL